MGGYEGVDLEVDLLVAAEVIDVSIVVHVFHLDGQAVIVEEAEAAR